ncbi:hypothetical protein HJ590_16500 [Naumannella sp. ID2617S]|nr:hypothetical protein [Naumannella sp. ID2617S]
MNRPKSSSKAPTRTTMEISGRRNRGSSPAVSVIVTSPRNRWSFDCVQGEQVRYRTGTITCHTVAKARST